jgi:curved DNA-binding protein CbpA
VRIPLDYYQILGIPESNLSELERAYQDRLLQLPRQEYSDAAIESRKQLITAAYQVLSDPVQRAHYESTQRSPALVNLEEKSPLYCRRELDIATEHFLGGLLILFEQGEYEEINTICMPYLGNNGRNSNSGSLHPHPQMSLSTSGNLRGDLSSNIDPALLAKLQHTANGAHIIPLKPDIVLTMVSSFYELGEREWKDRCYEAAVIHYETAKKILVQEDIFPQIQGQIDLKLDRLRPYRISSLVSLPLDRHEQRGQGIQFLEELLESACTNEVKCQEKFGLNSERTIPFIHETLPHLTAGEQRNLFSQVARDSHQVNAKPLNVMQLACTYLHVHALIAQGFAYRNPQLIYTAQQILQYRLSQRLDVTIEQAICALLLGQTDEANQILVAAPESAALIVIRQQSQGRPDLLRGLCLYVESWLKDEAFPCFRDLIANGNPALDAYFSDRDVQDFADRVPVADKNVTDWTNSSPQLIDVPLSGDLASTGQLQAPNLPQLDPSAALAPRTGRRSSSLNPAWQPHSDRLGSGQIAPAVRVEPSPPSAPVPAPVPAQAVEFETNNVIQLERERSRRRSKPTARTIDGQLDRPYTQDSTQTLLSSETSGQLITTAKSGTLVKITNTTGMLVRPRRSRRKANIPRILLFGATGATCIWIGTLLTTTILEKMPKWANLTIAPTPSPITIVPVSPSPTPTPLPKPPVVSGLLTTDVALETVTKWLSAKTKSFDREYQTAQLKDILVEPALSNAINRSKAAQGSGIHWEYKHPQIAVASITQANPTANVATIQARVEENAQYYNREKLDPKQSYSKKFLVEYSLIRQQDRWYIKGMAVVQRL